MEPTPTAEFTFTPPVEQPKDGPVSVQGLFSGLDTSPYMKAFIYSRPGQGKTALAASAPSPLYVDTENSSETLHDWPERRDNCIFKRIKEWNALDAVVQGAINGDYPDRETFVVDTITELRYQNLDALLAKRQGTFTPEGKDYQTSGEMMRRVMMAIRNLDMHVIILAHASEPNDRRIQIQPSLPDKLYDVMQGVFGLQAFLYIEDEGWDKPFKNVLQTRSNEAVQCKSRYKHLPPVIENPTWSKLMTLTQRWNEKGEWIA